MGAPFIAGGSMLLFLLRWKLNSMSLPEDEAKSLGIPVKRIRSLVIVGSAMVTAAVVSLSLIHISGYLKLSDAVLAACGEDEVKVAYA